MRRCAPLDGTWRGKMKNFVDEYKEMHASEKLRERVESIMKEKATKRNHTGLKASLCAVACFVLVAVSAVNLFPSLATAAEDVPVVRDIVRVITFGRYENHDDGYDASVTTPKLEGLLDKELEDKLNEQFKENAAAIIKAYEDDVRELKKEFGDETVHLGITSNYDVRTDNDDILAIDVWILNTAGSSSTVHSFYNIDKKTGKLLRLSDLFRDGTDYVTPISKYIFGEMVRMNKEGDALFWTERDEFTEPFEKIKDDQNFFINDKGNIVICFDKYEVAAGAQGCPEFEIPKEIISDIRK